MMPSGEYWNTAIETMDWSEVEKLQSVKLVDQLASVARRSAFYRRKFADAGVDVTDVRDIGDLGLLPFTTKDELRDSQIAAPPLGDHAAVELAEVIRVHSSSGTTGRPSYIGITRADRDVWTETVSRVYWCEGVRPDDVVIHGFGLGFFVGGLPLKDAFEHIGATFVPVGTGASERLVSAVENLGGTVLTCTPSYAGYLAEHLRTRHQIEPRELGLRQIALGAEPGGGIPAVRARIADDYGATVTEGLGNADLSPVYAAECHQQDGNHLVAPDYLLLELIDPRTRQTIPWVDGAEGELVATHLERECVPLVRFRVHDRVVVRVNPCACGRTSPRVICVGRTDDMLIVAGVNVWPSAVKDVIERMRPDTTGALEILLTEPGPGVDPPLRVRVEYGSEVTDLDDLEAGLESRLRDALIVRADVELVPPGTLPRYEMKAQLVRRLYEERTDVAAT